MIDLQLLKQFLFSANQVGYAAGEEKNWFKEADGSTTIFFQQKLWQSHDNFFGGEPYGGRMIVSYKDKPVWLMVYYGFVVKDVKPDLVYKILKDALKQMPANYPYRGPKEYQDEEYIYINSWQGEISHYSGEEQIVYQGKLVYKANYLGGLVNQRSGI